MAYTATGPLVSGIVIALSLALFLGLFVIGAHAQDSGPQIYVNMLNTDPTPVRAGASADVYLGFENLGSGTQPIEVRLVNSYPFSPAGAAGAQNITLGPYQTNNNYVNVKLTTLVDKSAVDGQYALEVQYRSPGGNWVMQNFSVSVTNQAFAQIAYIGQSQLDLGVQTPINFTVTNVGNAPLQNLVFSWTDKQGYILPVLGDNTRYIKYLGVGQSTTIPFTVIADVNAAPGLDELELSLSYESASNGAENILNTTAGIFVGGTTDFDVSYSESSAGQTSLSVANIGNSPAYAVKVSIPPQPGFRVVGSTSSIIGNLNKGDYTLVSFQFATLDTNASASGGAPQDQGGMPVNRSGFARGNHGSFNFSGTGFGGNNLTVDVEYTDAAGVRMTVVKSIRISNSMTGSGSFGGSGAYAGRQTASSWWQNPYVIALIVLVLGGGYWYYRRRKAKKA